MYKFNFEPVIAGLDKLLYGAWLTVQLSVAAMILGLIVSIVCAAAKTSNVAPLRWLINAYIEIIRNTPFLVQIFFIFFGLPSLGLRLTPNGAALLALVINFGAYGTEIIRAGIRGVAKGQSEASFALGLQPSSTTRLVVIPQAMRIIIPPLTSQYLNLTKNSSLGVAIGFPELVSTGGTTMNQTGQAVEVISIWLVVYLTISIATSLFMNWFNAKMALVER